MSRFSSAGLAAIAAASLAACSDVPVSPSGLAAPESSVFAVNAGGPEQVMAGEIVVRVKDGADVSEVARAHGLGLAEHGYRNAFAVLRGHAGAENANARALKSDSRVVWAEPNYLRQTTAINPNLWAFFNDGTGRMLFTSGKSRGQPLPAQYNPKSDADIDNIEAYAAGGSPVVIGSIDTGVDMDHPELENRLIAGRDWYNNDNDPSDENGHGTHTSGTMAGATVGVAGVSGAASNVQIHVQRVCGRRGCPLSAIANAIRAAADVPGMVAMNLSLGGSSLSQGEKDAIAYATGKGVLVIASSGNDGVGTVSCPACDPNAISVGSTNWADQKASYSNWGSGLDISAPGGQCYSNSTPEGCIYSAYLEGGYSWMQGTSMAAPQVTGAAAIVASKAGLTGAALRSRLEGTTDDLGASGYDTTFGNGRLNAYRAVTTTSLAAGQ